jgi:hypothetical protein
MLHEQVTGDIDPLQVRRVTLCGEVRAFAEHDAARAADRLVAGCRCERPN